MFNLFKKKKKFKKNHEILNYECINGHKWKSKEWPKGTYLFGEDGQTRCPVCKTIVCKCFSEDGKQGAIHGGFI